MQNSSQAAAYQADATVTFSQTKGARLALETRAMFAKSYLTDDYADALHRIGDVHTDKSTQIAEELKLQAQLMAQHETNILFITNRDLLLQKESYRGHGLLRENGFDLVATDQVVIDETPSLPEVAARSLFNVRDWFFSKQFSEWETDRLAFQTYAI